MSETKGTRRHAARRSSAAEFVIGCVLLPLAITAVGFLTLLPERGPSGADSTSILCLICGEFGLVDITLNTLLFVPVGLALSLLGFRTSVVVFACLCLSIAVEALQLTVIVGRDATLSDVVTNTAGGAVGAVIAAQWRLFVFSTPTRAKVGVASVALAWMTVRLCTSWLLLPSFPSTRWYGQIAPNEVYPANFRGTVVQGRIANVPAREGEMDDLRLPFSRADLRVYALVTGPAATSGLASVLSVADHRRSEILVLAQDGTDARLRFRLRSTDLLLRTPSVRLTRVFSTHPKAPHELSGALAHGALTLRHRTADDSASATLLLGPGLGWALLLPFDAGLTPSTAAAVTAVVAAAVMLALGFFAGRALPDRPRLALAATLFIAAACLWLPRLFFPEASVTLSEVMASVIGACAGATLSLRLPAAALPSG